jgi:F-type H+-transporting ATPase subunit gamma
MPDTIDSLTEQSKTISTLQAIAGAYSDISALRLTKLQKQFEQNVLYFEQIAQIYQSIRTSASSQKDLQDNIKKNISSKKKILHIALTSNKRFYGTLNQNIMLRFLEETTNTSGDLIVVGRTGIEYMKARVLKKPYETRVFAGEDPTTEELGELLSRCDEYERVYLFYPKYVNVIRQVADRLDISYAPPLHTGPITEIKYIFEPELSELLAFFTQQIRTILVRRVILETSLSRTATRLIAMDSAEKKAEESLDMVKRSLHTAMQAGINRELIEMITQRKKHG